MFNIAMPIFAVVMFSLAVVIIIMINKIHEENRDMTNLQNQILDLMKDQIRIQKLIFDFLREENIKK